MITVSTTSEREARAMAGLLRAVQAGFSWRIYLLGRLFSERGTVVNGERLPDIGLPHPANRPEGR
jgi:hypothetical protein